jgi:hypothetical protein
MKKLLFAIILLISFLSFGQTQDVNGISLNGPKDFVKIGDLHWNKGNENVIINYIKGDFNNLESAKSTCENGSRASDYVSFEKLEFNGKTIGLCFQKGHNSLSIGRTMVYRDGYTYNIIVSAEPDDYKRLSHILGYMITRITTQ